MTSLSASGCCSFGSTARAGSGGAMAEHHWQAYLAAETRLTTALVRPEREVVWVAGETRRSRAERAFEEARSFLEQCGDPQRVFPSVLIAGTSGKGSVAVLVARALRAVGLRVGLHTSPYLQVATEKIDIDGRLISGEGFAELLEWVWPVAAAARDPRAAAPAHGLAAVAMAAEAFRRAEVDIAVVEIGSGGRFDLNNHVRAVATCVTTVGLDHLQSLGPDLASIAWHKAGVARAAVPLVTAARGTALEVVRAEAETAGAPVVEVASSEPIGAGAQLPELNLRLAEAVLRALPERFSSLEPWTRLDPSAVLPGRLESVDDGRVILDGAHNPDKAEALARVLEARGLGRCVLVLGKVGSGDSETVLQPLARIASAVVTTEPEMPARPVARASALAETARRLGLEATAEPDPARALAAARRLVGSGPAAQQIVVTGSLFLVGQLRSVFFPRREVLVQRTSWPAPREGA